MNKKQIIIVLLLIFSLNKILTASIDQFVEYSDAKKADGSPERIISENNIFKDISINGLTLSNSIIKTSIFSHVKFKDIVASDITIRKSNFINSKLNNFNFNSSNLRGVKFVSTKPRRFVNVSFDKATIRGCRFVNVVFDTCSFASSEINECRFENCLFIGTNFKQVKFNTVLFKSCVFNTVGWKKPCKNFDLISDIEDVTFDACGFFKIPDHWYNFMPKYDLWINNRCSDDEELVVLLKSLGAEIINYTDTSFDWVSIFKFTAKSFVGGILTGSGMTIGDKIVNEGVSKHIPDFIKTPSGKFKRLLKRKNLQ